jgi:hypothetical protein
MAGRVEPMEWSTEFLPWFKSVWAPGQHMAVIAPTGAGKTTFNAGVLDYCRRYVLALDPKGGDTTLSTLGYERLKKWPGIKEMNKKIDNNDRDNIPSRFIIGGSSRTEEETEELRETLRKTLVEGHSMGGWTVYSDELQILVDPRMMNLRKEVDKLLIAARDRALSFVSSYQAPRWVTPQASLQSSWLAVSYTQDDDVVGRLAEVLGRSKNEVRGAFKGLDRFAWVIVGRDPREPYRVTIPDER